ncbi:MAG: ankyrin repeat domain-containing protein [Acidimicrobiales bacterium]
MSDRTTTVTIPWDDPTAVELLVAVRAGDVDLVRRLLSENPDLARARFAARGGTSTALHFATDWPGYFPNGPGIVKLLIASGADPNALTTRGGSDTPGPGCETPLHYAASSDDVDVAAALIDDGADVEAPGGSIGTPLDNAVGYACWHVARLLVMRGARVEKVWHAGALGMLELNERSQAVMRRVGMTHDPGDDFDAPWYEIGHPRGRFVLYRMTTSEWRHAAVKSGR